MNLPLQSSSSPIQEEQLSGPSTSALEPFPVCQSFRETWQHLENSPYQRLFQNASDGLFIASAEGIYLDANPALAVLLGYDSPAQLLAAQPLFHQRHYQSPDTWMESLQQLRAQSGAHPLPQLTDVMTTLLRRDGSSLRVLETIWMVRDGAGNPLYYEGVVKVVSLPPGAGDTWETQLQIEQSQARLLEAQRLAHLGNWNFDVVTQQTTWSEEMFRIFGLAPTAAAPDYREFLRWIHPDDSAAFQQAVRQMLDQQPCELDLRVYRADGQLCYVEARGEAFFDSQQRLVRLFGTVRDITDRKRAEAELQASEERFRSLVSNLSGAVYRGRYMPEWTIDYISEAIAQLSGYPAEDFLNNQVRSYTSIIDPEDVAAVRSHSQFCMDERLTFEMEYRIIHADGSVRWVYDKSIDVFDAAGDRLWSDGVLFDITQRKQIEFEHARAEEALRESEEKFRTLIQDLNVGVLLQGPEAEIFLSNPKALELLGLTEDQLLGKTSFDADWSVIHEDGTLFPGPEHPVPQAIATRQPVRNVVMGVHRPRPTDAAGRSSNLVWLLVNAEPQLGTNSQVRQVICTFLDISDRKQAEVALRESRETLRLALEAARMGAWEWDLHSNQQTWIALNEELFGLQPGNFSRSNRSLLDLVHPEDRQKLQSAYHQSLTGNTAEHQVEYRIVLPDGSLRWIATRGQVLRDEGGNPVRMRGVDLDITDFKRVQDDLRESRNRFRDLVETSSDWVWEVDENAVYTYASPQIVKILGYTPEEVVGKTPFDFMEPEEVARVATVFQAIAATAQPFSSFEHVSIRKDGTLVVLDTNGVPILDDQGTLKGYRGMDRDITGRKRAEGLLRQAKEAAEAANRAKSHFLASVSHELRTPLNAILGFTQLMALEPDTTAQQRETLAIINRSGENLLRLINDVLDMSKIEAGKITLENTAADLHDLLTTLQNTFQLQADHKQLSLCFWRDPAVPQWIQTDAGKLLQILTNLLSNAVKFTQIGEVRLRVELLPASEPVLRPGSSDGSDGAEPPEPMMLQFQVEDTGPGIADQDLERIFEPFVQTDTGRNSYQGTGLGLSISQRLTRLLGGDLSVRSTQGIGTVFQLKLPVQPAIALIPTANLSGQDVTAIAPDHPAYRVLVVDDSEVNCELLVRILQPLGFEVRQAQNGEVALQQWQIWQPALICMDLQMPGMDGHQAIQKIRAEENQRSQAGISTPRTKIIALTASAFDEERQRAIASGCDRFLPKPFQRDALLQTIAELLQIQYAYAKPQPALPELQTHTDSLQTVSGSASFLPLTPVDLRAMPLEWIAQLQQAVLQASTQLTLEQIHQIPPNHAPLAQSLQERVYNFRFEEILELTQQVLRIVD